MNDYKTGNQVIRYEERAMDWSNMTLILILFLSINFLHDFDFLKIFTCSYGKWQ